MLENTLRLRLGGKGLTHFSWACRAASKPLQDAGAEPLHPKTSGDPLHHPLIMAGKIFPWCLPGPHGNGVLRIDSLPTRSKKSIPRAAIQGSARGRGDASCRALPSSWCDFLVRRWDGLWVPPFCPTEAVCSHVGMRQLWGSRGTVYKPCLS